MNYAPKVALHASIIVCVFGIFAYYAAPTKAGAIETKCGAVITLLQAIHNQAVVQELHTFAEFEAEMRKHPLEIPAKFKGSILGFAETYYNSVQLPWLVARSTERITLAELQRFWHGLCIAQAHEIQNKGAI